MNPPPADAEDCPVAVEEASCPLGCERADEPVLTGRDRFFGLPGTFQVVRCRHCGLARTTPRPTPEGIGFYYPPDYGPYRGTRVEQRASGEGVKARAVALAKRVLNTRASFVPPLRPGKLLEVGCASGSYLDKMAAEGWSVEGIEFAPEPAAAARALGFPVDTGAIETIEKPEGVYDLVVGWMVLEHVHDPVGSLRKLARWTKPDGMLALSVPNAGAAEFRLFKSRWYALQLPTHLYHFDPSTLTKVLAAGGWNVERIFHQRTVANAIASTGYWLADKGWRSLGQRLIDFPEKGGRLGSLALFPLACAMAAFGQTGRMTVWARRIPA